MNTSVSDYLPVSFDFREILEEQKNSGNNGLIHYFKGTKEIESARGAILDINKNETGEFLNLDSGDSIRLDKIITLFGKPGPAYDTYDAFANACFSCMGGMDDD
ncbi:MAG: hypothetical protein JJU28_22200 [Cyclobacteriaceae bacterium]|nr:hypothetical protein [Cyclobacteriaceae bacterium]